MPASISRRAKQMPESPIRKLAPFADAAKERGVHIYHLNIGQPDIETPAAMRDRLRGIDEKVLAYTPSGGTHEMVEAFRQYYARMDIPVAADEILVTTGGSEAALFAFLACADQGDELLVIEPFYTNYSAFATMGGVRLVPLTSRGEDGFHLPSPSAWARALTKRTKGVILCNPNNPTGTVYRADELATLASFCREHGLFLISDEVYREFVYDGNRTQSALTLPDIDDLVVVVDSLSKRYSACGIRLGALVTRNVQIRDAAMCMAQARLSPPGLAQSIGASINELDPDYIPSMIADFERRRDVLYAGLSAIDGVFLRKPEGAFYLMPRLPVEDSENFCRWMLSDFQHDGATVMMAPAPGFYATAGLGKSEVRIAYVLNEDDLRKSVEILARGLSAYRSGGG